MSKYAYLAVAVVLVIALAAFGHRERVAGRNEVQADWNKANADRANAEKAAVLARVSENQGLFRQQEITNQNITKAHNDELTRVRADLSRAPRLRIGSALCGGPASTAQAAGTGSGNAADTGSRVLSPEMDGIFKSLILEMEQAAATGRACQSFVQTNGMAPK